MRNKFCFLCGKMRIRFYLQDEKRDVWKCPDPLHPARVKKMKRRLMLKAQKKRWEK